MGVTIYRRALPYHPMLGRHVHFDSRSRGYALQPKAVPIRSVRHESYVGVLDQGSLGSCTGNAAVSALYHDPVYAAGALWPRYTPDEGGAVLAYEDFTRADPYTGSYPPDDTGSDGLTACKVVKSAKDISGYQAALDLASSLDGLMSGPGITGIPWYESMFDTDSSGLLTVDVSSGLAGGHELCVDEVVLPDAMSNGTGKILVGGPNSWGPGWGANGRWYMTASDWWMLRQNEGDVYFWTPVTQPAPVGPTDPGDVLWAATKGWAHARHVGSNKTTATAVITWASNTGRS